MDPTGFIFSLIVLIFSVMIHEVSHGYVAEALGDPTARLAGRLTLNPLKHIDPMGSIIVPILSGLFGQAIGWAKPVPYNPNNLKNPSSGAALIGVAGPLSNFLLAAVFGVIIRVSLAISYGSETLIGMFAVIVYMNIFLGILNLLPIPPLDGSKLLFALLPFSMRKLEDFLVRWNFAIILFLLYFLSSILNILEPLIRFIFNLMTGA